MTFEIIGTIGKNAHTIVFSHELFANSSKKKRFAVTASALAALGGALALNFYASGKVPTWLTHPITLASVGGTLHATSDIINDKVEEDHETASKALKFGVKPAMRGLVYGALAAALYGALRNTPLYSKKTALLTGGITALTFIHNGPAHTLLTPIHLSTNAYKKVASLLTKKEVEQNFKQGAAGD